MILAGLVLMIVAKIGRLVTMNRIHASSTYEAFDDIQDKWSDWTNYIAINQDGAKYVVYTPMGRKFESSDLQAAQNYRSNWIYEMIQIERSKRIGGKRIQ